MATHPYLTSKVVRRALAAELKKLRKYLRNDDGRRDNYMGMQILGAQLMATEMQHQLNLGEICTAHKSVAGDRGDEGRELDRDYEKMVDENDPEEVARRERHAQMIDEAYLAHGF